MKNPLDNFGYYIAGNKKYYSKVEAIMSLPPNSRDIRWWFHDDVFENFDWSQEPVESLDELYLERAHQLRDEYDYLVLCYSGGSDSAQMLATFDNNNIPFDEVHMHGSFETDKTRKFLSKDPSFFNAEIYNIAEPRIQELQKKYPNLKVTHYDWTRDIIDDYKKDKNFDWIFEAGCRFTPNMVGRSHIHSYTKDLRKLQDSSKRVAFVWGVDKPRIIYRDDGWHIFFLDLLTSLSTNMRSKLLNLTNEVDELFYWSPSSAKILAKQAHLVKRHVTANPVTFQYFKSIGLSDLHVEKYYDLIKPAIYPNTYDPTLLQCNKAKPIYTERDWWFYEEDNRSFKVWEDGLGLIQSVIDPYWFNKGTIRDGIKGSPSKFYKFSGT
jgi:hypothetical protein